jgi:hypothetical protein
MIAMTIPKDQMDDAQRQRLLGETTLPDFLDSSVEWPRIFSEM